MSYSAKGQVKCKFCNGHYDYDSEQPVCSLCHAFVYEFATDTLADLSSVKEKEASNDSGNEEPERPFDLLFTERPQDSLFYYPPCPQLLLSTDTPNAVSKSSSSPPFYANTPCPYRLKENSGNNSSFHGVNPSYKRSPLGSLDQLPAEVLLRIMSCLDDMSLWNLRLVSRRFSFIIDTGIPDRRWAEFVAHRWPIFVPRHHISSWRLLYLNMMESVTCRPCLSRLRSPVLFPVEAPNRRFRRIISEIKSLCNDPPYGIRALAVDTDTYAHCLAGISGPSTSPYEGGLFYVHVLIPDSHPMRPPVIRFLTRILHPNISFHGDIGLDCIQHNWSLALTLDKLLLSIQSLLTDPYTKVCMEPSIGDLYNRDRDRFEELAKLWTWKFACHDYLSTSFVSQLTLPDYMD